MYIKHIAEGLAQSKDPTNVNLILQMRLKIGEVKKLKVIQNFFKYNFVYSLDFLITVLMLYIINK